MLKDFVSICCSIVLHVVPLFFFNNSNLYISIGNKLSIHNKQLNKDVSKNIDFEHIRYKRSINLKSFKKEILPIIKYNPQMINNNSKIDSRSIYQDKDITSNDRVSVEINGWSWGEIPEIEDFSNEIGKIVFEFILDEFGDIISIKTLESNVNQSVETIYRNVVSRIKFSRLDDNKSIDNTIGKISFILQYE